MSLQSKYYFSNLDIYKNIVVFFWRTVSVVCLRAEQDE